MKPSTQRKKEKAEYATKKINQNKKEISPSPREVTGLTKYVDYSAATRVCSDSRIHLLNAIASGTDSYQRTGRVTIAKSLKLTITFTMLSSPVTVFPGDIARLIVLWDRQGETTPVSSDIFLDTSAAGTTQTSYAGYKNPNNKSRFIYLYDKRVQLPSFIITTAGAVASTPCPQMPNGAEWTSELDIDLTGLTTRYKDTGSTVASISEGSLHFFILGGVAAASSGWNVSFTSRFSYYDS